METQAVAKFKSISMAALALMSVPAFAQDEVTAPSGEKINQLIIYGEDKCPESTDDVIVVCGRMGEADRYRIPPALRSDPNNLKNQAWLNRVQAYEYVGKTGAMSCTTSGSGGFTGCNQKFVADAYKEKEQDPGISFGLMIAEERKKRLSGIDADAAKVEELEIQSEKERAARQAKLEAQLSAQGQNPPTDETDAEPLPEPD